VKEKFFSLFLGTHIAICIYHTTPPNKKKTSPRGKEREGNVILKRGSKSVILVFLCGNGNPPITAGIPTVIKPLTHTHNHDSFSV
jgi:hypothetical protein